MHLSCHQSHELSKVDRVGSVSINLCDQFSVHSAGVREWHDEKSASGMLTIGIDFDIVDAERGVGHDKPDDGRTSLIISSSSAWVGFWPNERMTVPSSLAVIVPSPSI